MQWPKICQSVNQSVSHTFPACCWVCPRILCIFSLHGFLSLASLDQFSSRPLASRSKICRPESIVSVLTELSHTCTDFVLACIGEGMENASSWLSGMSALQQTTSTDIQHPRRLAIMGQHLLPDCLLLHGRVAQATVCPVEFAGLSGDSTLYLHATCLLAGVNPCKIQGCEARRSHLNMFQQTSSLQLAVVSCTYFNRGQRQPQ